MAVSNIGKGAILSYVAIVFNIAISFFYTPWMIKQIGLSDYGLYNLALSFISYFVLDFGLNQAVQRFIAKYRAENDELMVSKMIGITTRVYLIIDSVIFAILLILYFFLEGIFTGLTPVEIERLKVLYAIAGICSVLSFMFRPMAGVMMAYEYFVEEKILELINRVGAVLLICIALLLGADVFALVLVNGIVSVLTSFFKFIVFKRKSKLKILWSYFDKNQLKAIFSFSLWTMGTGLAQRMRITIIPTILGILSNSHEIAIFALYMSLDAMFYSFTSAMNGLFMPKVARAVVSEDREAISELMIKVGRLQLYIITLLFTGFCVFGSQFIHLWVGDEFKDVYLLLIMGTLVQPILLTQTIAKDLIYIENKIKYSAMVLFITSIIGLLAIILLVPKHGALGAGIGSTIGDIFYLVWINYFYGRGLKLNMKIFFCECHGRILPLLAVFSCLSYMLTRMLAIDNWLYFGVAVFVYTIIFGAICYCLLFNKYEKSLIQR